MPLSFGTLNEGRAPGFRTDAQVVRSLDTTEVLDIQGT